MYYKLYKKLMRLIEIEDLDERKGACQKYWEDHIKSLTLVRFLSEEEVKGSGIDVVSRTGTYMKKEAMDKMVELLRIQKTREDNRSIKLKFEVNLLGSFQNHEEE